MYSIYRVRKHLCDVNKKAYEPEIIAIGPYHHGNKSFKMMEEHKTRYLKSLLARKGQTIGMYTEAIQKLEGNAIDCYAEPIGLARAKFTEMLVRDGCFIIELLRKCADTETRERNDPIFEMEWMENSLQRDLLLFENQIPFFVLCKLFDLVEEPGKHGRLIELVLKFWDNLYAFKWKRDQIGLKKIKHLLDLVHQYYHPDLAGHCSIRVDHVVADAFNTESAIIHPATEHGRESVIINVEPLIRESVIIHSARELKKANVKFQKKENANTLFDVDFEEGVIRMPPLTIEERTESFFRNFIAHEHYFKDGGEPNYVADYAWLLNCLIDCQKDVEILSQAGIVDNLLGDHKAVAQFVNRLSRTVSSPGDVFYYAKLFKKVNAHYKKGWNRACATLKRDYCYSPWATVAVLAASAILLLTLTQTVFSVLQVV